MYFFVVHTKQQCQGDIIAIVCCNAKDRSIVTMQRIFQIFLFTLQISLTFLSVKAATKHTFVDCFDLIKIINRKPVIVDVNVSGQSDAFDYLTPPGFRAAFSKSVMFRHGTRTPKNPKTS